MTLRCQLGKSLVSVFWPQDHIWFSRLWTAPSGLVPKVSCFIASSLSIIINLFCSPCWGLLFFYSSCLLHIAKENFSKLEDRSIENPQAEIQREKGEKQSSKKKKKKKAQHLRSNGQFQNMQHMFYWKTRRTKEKQSQRNIWSDNDWELFNINVKHKISDLEI